MPRRSAISVLESWGFGREGRLWRRGDLRRDVDLVGSYHGSPGRSVEVETPDGPVRIAAPEDMVLRRLVGLKHWKPKRKWRAQAVEQITVLLPDDANQLNSEYIHERATREDILDVLEDFRRNVRPPGT